MRWINLDKVVRVSELVGELLSALDAVPRAEPGSDRAEPRDTIEFEIRMIQKIMGRSLQSLLSAVGLPSLRTREDIDRLAEIFRGRLMV
jgi:hypothetical protein